MGKKLQTTQVLEKNIFRHFPVSQQMLRRLKGTLSEHDLKNVTSFDVMTAHVWQARTKAMIEVEQIPPQQLLSVLYAIDIRNRISPELPDGYCGNAIMSGCAQATAQEIWENKLSFCVKKVQVCAFFGLQNLMHVFFHIIHYLKNILFSRKQMIG